jgi:hypothetical protein
MKIIIHKILHNYINKKKKTYIMIKTEIPQTTKKNTLLFTE